MASDDPRERAAAGLRSALGELGAVPAELRRALGRRDLLVASLRANLDRLAAHPARPLRGFSAAELRPCDEGPERLLEVRLARGAETLAFLVRLAEGATNPPARHGHFAAVLERGATLATQEQRLVAGLVLEAVERTALALGAPRA